MIAALLPDGPVLWYANRATGYVLLLLLTLSAALGVIATARAGTVRWPRFATQALHRNVSLLSVVMLVAHVAAAVVDEYVDIRWYDGLVPFVGNYERVWMGLGTAATDLLVLVIVSSLVRHRFPHRAWRGIHLSAYLAWALGVVHGLLIGTDAQETWSLGITVGCVGLVAACGVLRLATLRHERRITA